MPESIFDVLIFALAIVFFLGRVVYRAKNKTREPPPKVKIPVHFEDEKESEYFKGKAPAVAAKAGKKNISSKVKKPPALKQPVNPPQQESSPDAPLLRTPANKTTSDKNFLNNLGHLSPMKQAVVLAEILGTPKGLQ